LTSAKLPKLHPAKISIIRVQGFLLLEEFCYFFALKTSFLGTTNLHFRQNISTVMPD